MNAIAHRVEALYAQDANPITSLMAEEGIRALARALADGRRRTRTTSRRAATRSTAPGCAAPCLGTVGMALHHKLCHTLGGSFNLPHAETHTVVLPHATAYNARAAPEAMARIARALGAQDAAAAWLYDLARALGAPTALSDIGMPADGLDRAADLAVTNPYCNPRPSSASRSATLLQAPATAAVLRIDRNTHNTKPGGVKCRTTSHPAAVAA